VTEQDWELTEEELLNLKSDGRREKESFLSRHFQMFSTVSKESGVEF